VDYVGYASFLAVAFPNREYCELVRELYGARNMPYGARDMRSALK
jgi:hypothetical protein